LIYKIVLKKDIKGCTHIFKKKLYVANYISIPIQVIIVVIILKKMILVRYLIIYIFQNNIQHLKMQLERKQYLINKNQLVFLI